MMRKIELIFLFFAAFLIAAATLVFSLERPININIQHVHLDKANKIIDINDALVVPVLYDSLIINRFLPIDERKKQFVNQVLPAILIVKYQLENKSKSVQRIINKIEAGETLRPVEQAYADSLMTIFNTESLVYLLKCMKPHQTSLVLAQAAVESGWGSSRFAIEGNNLFGIWTTSGDPDLIKSLYKREEKSVFVKKYSTVAESIDHYFLTLGRHHAYTNFRTKRYEEADVFQLIETLGRYSEQGEEYTKLLKKIIEWNNLQDYDNYQIDPNYLVEESIIKSLVLKIKDLKEDWNF